MALNMYESWHLEAAFSVVCVCACVCVRVCVCVYESISIHDTSAHLVMAPHTYG